MRIAATGILNRYTNAFKLSNKKNIIHVTSSLQANLLLGSRIVQHRNLLTILGFKVKRSSAAFLIDH